MRTCLILDDYQQAALALADWTRLSDRVAVSAIAQHIANPDDLVARIAQAEILVIMRERTPFPAALLERAAKSIADESAAVSAQASRDAEHATTAPADREDLAEIQKAGQRAAALTRQLLAFSRRQPTTRKSMPWKAMGMRLHPSIMLPATYTNSTLPSRSGEKN